jgi:hypothetical protein
VNAASAAADSLHCPLQEGVTTFVVQVPKGSDHLTFINENTAVRGDNFCFERQLWRVI